MTRLAALAAAITLAAGAAGGVVVVGRAPATGDAATDRAAALADARRRAVEAAVGVIVDATVRLENQLLIEDKLYTKSRGLVTNEVVTAEGEGDGFYQVTLSCDVEDLGLAAELDRLKNAIIVRVAEEGRDGEPRPSVESILREKLVADGFRCLDAAFIRGKEAEGEVARAAALPPAELQTLGRKYLTQVIIYGDVAAKDAGAVEDKLPYVAGNPLAGLRVAYAVGNVKAVDTSSGQILAEREARPGEFAGFGDDYEEAAADALARLAEAYAACLAERLADLR